MEEGYESLRKRLCLVITLAAAFLGWSGLQIFNIQAATASSLKLNNTSMVVGIGKYNTISTTPEKLIKLSLPFLLKTQ